MGIVGRGSGCQGKGRVSREREIQRGLELVLVYREIRGRDGGWQGEIRRKRGWIVGRGGRDSIGMVGKEGLEEGLEGGMVGRDSRRIVGGQQGGIVGRDGGLVRRDGRQGQQGLGRDSREGYKRELQGAKESREG